MKYFLRFTLQNNPPLYLDTGTQLLKYGPIISEGPGQNLATVFHLKPLVGTGEDVNTPGMDTHLQIGSEETLTVIKKLETDMEQIFETDGYGVPGPREFRCHMIPIVTPDVPAKLNQVTETAYCIEFKPGGTPQVFTVKEKAGKCLSFSVDLGSKKKAYMQIPNALSSMSENMVQMNTEVEEKDSFVVLPEIMIGPPIPESVTGGGTVWRRRWVKTGAGL